MGVVHHGYGMSNIFLKMKKRKKEGKVKKKNKWYMGVFNMEVGLIFLGYW